MWLMSHCLLGSLLADALGVAEEDCVGSRLGVEDGVLLGVADGVAVAPGVAALRTAAECASGTTLGVPEGEADGVADGAGVEAVAAV
jgi:hypothetical protein